MKRNLKIAFTVFMVMTVLCIAAVCAGADSGECGTNVYWSTNEDNTILTLWGNGSMSDYSAPVYVPYKKYDDTIQKIIIDEGVSYVGAYAFYGYSEAVEITIPNSLKSTGNLAFAFLNSVESVYYYGTEADWSSFSSGIGNVFNNAQLYLLSDGGSVGDDIRWMLEHDGTLTLVGTGAMVEYADKESVPWYRYAGKIKEIHIKKGITSISAHAFEEVYNIEKTYYYSTKENWEAIVKGEGNSVLDETLACIFDYGTTTDNFDWILYADGHLVITGEGAMSSYSNSKDDWTNAGVIRSVTIGEGITTIGESAFYYGTSIESVSLPSTLVEIGKAAFSNCKKLKSIAFPETLKIIGDRAFIQCEQLTHIEMYNNIEKIGSSAFYKNNSTDAVLYYCGTEEDWGKISVAGSDYNTNYTFYITYTRDMGNCGENIRYMLAYDGNLYLFGQGDMYDYTSESPAPWSIWGEGIRYTHIDEGITGIGEGAFTNCGNLEYVFFKGSVEQWSGMDIGENNSCLNSAEIYIEYARGTAGESIDWVLDHDGTLLVYGEGAMDDVSNYYTQPYYDYDDKIKKVIVGEGITATGTNAFAFLNMKEVKLPSTLTTIGSRSFLSNAYLTKIELPENLTTIGYQAFDRGVFTSIEIPVSVQSVDEYAFSSCDNLKYVFYRGTKAQWESIAFGKENTDLTKSNIYYASDLGNISNDAMWVVTQDATLYILGRYDMANYESEAPWYKYKDSIENVKISSNITLIGDNAFKGLDKVSKINIPDKVTSIGKNAFMGCSGLTELVFSGSLLKIDDGAMKNCSKLETVLMYSPEYIGKGAFSGCISLNDVYYAGTADEWEAVEIGDNNEPLAQCGVHGVMTMGECDTNLKWFIDYNGILAVTGEGEIKDRSNYQNAPWEAYNESILHISVGEGITRIGENAFRYTENALTLSIPSTVTSLGDSFAEGCSSLQYVVIPGRITAVPSWAFTNCTSLKYIALEEGVTTLGYSSLERCSSLEAVFLPSTFADVEDWVFEDCDLITSVYYAGNKTQFDSVNLNLMTNSALYDATVYFEYELYFNDCGYRIVEYRADDTDVIVSCKLSNNTTSSIKRNVYVALYNSEGILKGVKKSTFSISKGKQKESALRIEDCTLEEGDYIKLFVWDAKKYMYAESMPVIRRVEPR